MTSACDLLCSTILTEMHVKVILKLLLSSRVIMKSDTALFALDREILIKQRNILGTLSMEKVD